LQILACRPRCLVLLRWAELAKSSARRNRVEWPAQRCRQRVGVGQALAHPKGHIHGRRVVFLAGPAPRCPCGGRLPRRGMRRPVAGGLIGRPPVAARMWPSAMIKTEIGADRSSRFGHRIVGAEIDRLGFARPPMPRDKDIATPSLGHAKSGVELAPLPSIVIRTDHVPRSYRRWRCRFCAACRRTRRR
jgi:hypothetical protein